MVYGPRKIRVLAFVATTTAIHVPHLLTRFRHPSLHDGQEGAGIIK